MESKFRVSPDVGRYNSSDDDNVTQVWTGHVDKRHCGGVVVEGGHVALHRLTLSVGVGFDV